MARDRLSAYRTRVREALETAFGEDLPPNDVALSFSFGVFVAALPNFGIALVLFAGLARYVDRVSKLALLAAVLVMNPPVKWAVYVASFWLSSQLLGPGPEISTSELSLSLGPEVFVHLFAGSLIIAALIAAVSYAVALRVVRELRRREIAVVETLPDVLHDETD